MKKIIFAVTLIACSSALIAQQLYDTIQSKKTENQLAAEAYLKKAKNQKTTAIVLGASGALTTIAGLAIGLHGFANGFDFQHPDKGGSQMNTGSVLMVTGLSMCVAAIPFSIAGKHNQKKRKTNVRYYKPLNIIDKEILKCRCSNKFLKILMLVKYF